LGSSIPLFLSRFSEKVSRKEKKIPNASYKCVIFAGLPFLSTYLRPKGPT